MNIDTINNRLDRVLVFLLGLLWALTACIVCGLLIFALQNRPPCFSKLNIAQPEAHGTKAPAEKIGGAV